MAAWLRPHPLVELKRSPDTLAAVRGPTSKSRERKGRVRKGREWRTEGRGKGRGDLLHGVRWGRRPCIH